LRSATAEFSVAQALLRWKMRIKAAVEGALDETQRNKT
jgi:hypothetical protein